MQSRWRNVIVVVSCSVYILSLICHSRRDRESPLGVLAVNIRNLAVLSYTYCRNIKKRRNPQVDSRLPGSFSMCVAYVLNATFSLSSASTRILRGQARLSRWNPSPLFPKKIPLLSHSRALLRTRSWISSGESPVPLKSIHAR